MPIEQIIVLAIVQGITEFLPISSSGHLILVPALTGWPDQGLATDVMVHVGSLFAILVYFWRDVLRLMSGVLDLAKRRWTTDAKLAVYIAAATIPAVIFGLVLKATGFLDSIRGIEIVAWNALIFGLLLLIADRIGPQVNVMENMTFRTAMLIGLAQALALIPGTSRSGITMTAARYLGYTRPEAARFSFLLGIPAIAGAGLLTVLDLESSGAGVSSDALLAAAFTFVSALIAIAFLMAVVKRLSFLPFVIYRFLIAGFLFVLAYS
ncbi:MAG: undecaprenyl-diphosphate phosphatase [Hyphomicrobiales bacterium]|nr:undecaprenyl-diphosphate phosphatase [Hyphomicrobiales bacterium]